MIIQKLKATNVHGYMNLDMSFNEDLSFLVGGNGGGKTTALKILKAILKPNFKEIFEMQFSDILVIITIKDVTHSIFCSKNNEEIRFSISGINLNIDDFIIDLKGFKNTFGGERFFLEQLENFSERIENDDFSNDYIEFIKKIPMPLFLGLDRQLNSWNNKMNIGYERHPSLWNSKTSNYERHQNLNIVSLEKTKEYIKRLIEKEHRIFKRREEIMTLKLKDSILESLFEYKEFRSYEGTKSQEILERKNEILELISKLYPKKKKIYDKVNNFFDRLKDLKTSNDVIDVNQLFNQPQVDIIFNMLKLMEENKEKTNKLYEKMDKFLEVINKFYYESNKKVSINPLGKLEIQGIRKKCNLEHLSSGESQLFVILGYSFFENWRNNKGNSRKKVVIIDEPELSLHILWQEMLVPTLMETDINTQFIMATHSPDIVSEYEEKAILLRRNNVIKEKY